MAEPIGWIERYALATDRAGVLEELIPGTDDYYFYHCLHFQVSGELDRSEAMLKDWIALHKGRETPTIQNMVDRQRLLTYDTTPQRTIDYLIKRLSVNLNHAPPATKDQRRFPSELNSATLDLEKLVNDAVRSNRSLKPVAMQYLAKLFLRNKANGISIKLRDFLNRVNGPYIDNLDTLVIKELKSRRPNQIRFGDLSAHGQLTMSELKSVAKSVPQVADDSDFVHSMLRHLRPHADNDPSQQPKVRLEYLKRVEAYTRTLRASHNSLKAASTFRLLEANLAHGVFDRDLFMRYLSLPRSSSIIHPEFIRRNGNRANLNEDFMQIALLPPVGNEEAVVRTHLEQFLRDAPDTSQFDAVLQPDYLKRVFAETKLISGVGDEAQWYPMLSASQRKLIRDAIELRLSSENPTYFGSDAPAKLIVDVKNIPELVVRIYEINTSSYYRTNDRPVDTDIDLDGLVATHERKINYNQPSVRRHREQLALTEITGRGVWIVDLVGKGVRARALIRRGSIDYVGSRLPNGMRFTIIDENRSPIPKATMWVGAREFVADDAGQINIPFVGKQTNRRAVIVDNSIARKITFQHLKEQHSLDAGMHIDRTLLQSGGEASLLIRPRLLMNSNAIDPKLLQDVTVRIETKDLDGVPIAHEVSDLNLNQNGELEVPIRVPPRMTRLTATLSGKVNRLSDSKQETLSTSRSWDIAGIRRTNQTHDAFLTRDQGDFVIEVRGRNGELVPRASVRVNLSTTVSDLPVESTLQADNSGQIRLGELTHVSSIEYSVLSGITHRRDLTLDRADWPNETHSTSEREIQLPLGESIAEPSERFRLFSVREESIHEDHTNKLSVSDGLLTVGTLKPGDYSLVDRKTFRQYLIAVVEGQEVDSVAVGATRHLEVSTAVPLGIAAIEKVNDGWKVQLSGDTRTARVHVYATRYLDQTSPYGQLDAPAGLLEGRGLSLERCGYISDLRLGDEYQYVLRRRYAKKYPGVMLPQAGVILNPWETEETSNSSQSVTGGDAPKPSAEAAPGRNVNRSSRSARRQAKAVTSDFDFLADSGVVAANLRPDENGVVTLPAELVGGLPILQVIACDALTMVQRTVSSALPEAETMDLRLEKALDAAKAYTFQRGVTIASPDQPLDIESLGTAQLQVYSSVGDLMKLYDTLSEDSRLSDFKELASWHTMDDAAKADAYSRLASHELHLFLWFHDRSFFNEIVGPYLANKKEKQFIDHWLLEHDLNEYTTLWRYNELNAAERALLAMRVPDTRENVTRELRENVETQQINHAAAAKRVESALSISGAMAFGGRVAGGAQAMEEVDGTVRLNMQTEDMDMLFSAPVELDMKAQRGRAAAKQRKMFKEFKNESSDLELLRGQVAMQQSAFYRDLDSTKQWAESQWDRQRTIGGPNPSTLIGVNAFWSQLASMNADQIEVSTELLSPIENRHAALVALATCGLPLSAGKVDLPTKPDMPYRPEHAVAVVTKRLKMLEVKEGESSILIGQRFESIDDTKGANQSEARAEPTEFLVGTAYRGQIVISNPTAAQRTVDVFWQLPSGSVPLTSSQMTDSQTITLQPFAVQAVQYEFYFPNVGQFSHYPATVGEDGDLLGQADSKTFTVVEQPTKDDSITWEKLAVSGSAEEIRDFLAQANLRQIEWIRVAHRMRDQDVYQVIIDTLSEANINMSDLWGYSLHHKDVGAMREFLAARTDLAKHVGPVIRSSLLDVDPINRRTHELLEYAPLVRARIHRLGEQDEILNPTFLQQYQQFVRNLAYTNEINSDEKLVLAYYLLIQNRITEAIETFDAIDRDDLETQLQYDFLKVYLTMHRGQYEQAEQVARQHAEHPIPRWNARFNAAINQLIQRRELNQVEKLVSVDEPGAAKPIAEDSGDLSVIDREQRQAAAAKEQPEVIVRIEGDTLRIDHRVTHTAELNFYAVDLELLFSKAPFVREDLQRMAMVRPTKSELLQFDDSNGVAKYVLDNNLRRQTLLVEVVSDASRSTALYYGGDITTYVSESFGQLQTTDAKTGRPISAAYVKVYAKYPSGNVRFYKDGYTDSRGRFDYVSLSAADAKGASRFAILVMDEEKGATLHDVAAPNR